MHRPYCITIIIGAACMQNMAKVQSISQNETRYFQIGNIHKC